MSVPFPFPRAAAALGGCNATVVGLEVRRVLRNVRTLILIVVMPTSFFLLYGLPSRDQHPGSGLPLAGIMVSMAAYGAMVGATSCGASVAVERALGWHRQLRFTPLRPLAQVTAKTVAAMALGLVAVLAEFVLGAAFGVRLSPRVWLLAALAAWLPSMVFALLGLFAGLLLPSENVMQLVGPVLALLAVFGGLFIPLDVLPQGVQDLAPYTPAYGAGALARACLGQGPVLTAVAGLASWTAIFAAASVWRLRQDTTRT